MLVRVIPAKPSRHAIAREPIAIAADIVGFRYPQDVSRGYPVRCGHAKAQKLAAWVSPKCVVVLYR